MIFALKRTRRRIGLSLLAAGMAISPLTSTAETLSDALIGAYNSSGLLQQNRAVLRAADEDVALAVAGLRPTLAWTAQVQRSAANSASASTGGLAISTSSTTATMALTASLLLYDNGQTKLAGQAAQETVLATRQALISAEQTVLFNAVQAFMSVRRETETVALRENNVRLITQELRAVEDRFEVGEVTRTDVALAEARLAQARAALATAQGDLENARQTYLAVVGRLPGALTPPAGLPARPANADGAKAVALRLHPDIRQLQHQIAAADFNVKRAQAVEGFSVSLTGRLSSSETDNSPNFTDSSSLSIDVSRPLYQGGAISAGVRKAMAQRDQIHAGLYLSQQSITQGVANALVRYDVANANLEAVDRQIRAARVAFRGVREEAALGSRTTLDVLDAEQELLDAEAARISAQSEQAIAAYQVLSAQGLLTASQLNLPVQQYDPEAYYNLVKSAPHPVSRQGQQLDKVLRSLGKD